MTPQGRRAGPQILLVLALSIGLLAGIAVPALSQIPVVRALPLVGPALFVLWVPEIAVVLLQDALGIIRTFTLRLGFDIESGFAIATGVAAVLGYGLLAMRQRLNTRALLSPVALLNYGMVGVLGASLLYGGGAPYGLQKLIGFVSFNLLGFVLTSLTPAARRRRLLYAFILVGLFGMLGLALTAVSGPATTRLVAFGGNPIWTARLLAAAALITLWLPRRSYALKLPLAGLFLAGAVTTGSRGPLLGAAAAVGLAVVSRVIMARDRREMGQSLLLLAALLLAGVFGLLGLRQIAQGQAEADPRSPFVRIFGETREAERSSEARLYLYELSLLEAAQNPLFGAGLGRLEAPEAAAGPVYSHNLLLEFASETGAFGLVLHLATMLLVVILAAPYLHAPEARARQDVSIGLMMLVFCYVNAQFSGDIVGNKMLWFFMGYLNGIVRVPYAAGRRVIVASRRGERRAGVPERTD